MRLYEAAAIDTQREFDKAVGSLNSIFNHIVKLLGSNRFRNFEGSSLAKMNIASALWMSGNSAGAWDEYVQANPEQAAELEQRYDFTAKKIEMLEKKLKRGRK